MKQADAPAEFLLRLALLGLRSCTRVETHTNRTVMVSLSARGVLRLHRGYTFAPDAVLRAIVRFLDPRLPREQRRAAECEFLVFPVEDHAPPPPGSGRRDRPRPGDLRVLHRLYGAHERFNREHFEGLLGSVPIRLSGRMRTRLGELSVDMVTGRALEIAISRRHIARHLWTEVEHTLLHEMVHQWQAETGSPVDHDVAFRRKAAQVGVLPSARRAPLAAAGP
ncbi:MAG: SprT-like domain-containing protein [Gemmatimonadales bacterium]|nr:SprT-like domain-containing protein [Gemmatimonadales bacterium]